jgi:nucleoside phosphorylase
VLYHSLQNTHEMPRPIHPIGSYSIGIVCALSIEKAAVDAVLDEEHRSPEKAAGDDNSYTFGKIGEHNVVAACLPAGVTGKVSAAAVAKDMMRSFPIKAGFMVGVGGGVWSEQNDVRLGDVVVSEPHRVHGGVVQWDFGKMQKEGVFERTGTLNKPPRPLLSAVQNLKSIHERKDSEVAEHLTQMLHNNPKMKKTFGHPGRYHDRLFRSSYQHPSGYDCTRCDRSKLLQHRLEREDDTPQIHYGNIASGDEVMKDGPTRDRIAREEEILCFEMEAAGLMDAFPCVVIRGVCDYADSHKNKQWQRYAAATAACYCKELLSIVDRQGIAELSQAGE